MTWDKRLKMLLGTDGSDTWATASMRDGEGLVKVEMTHVSSDYAGRCESQHSVKVGSVEINLTTIVMDNIADLLDTSFEHSMC